MTPLGDRVLVERIDDTDGKERTLESGLVIPARDLTLKHGRAERIPDTFRARVIAASRQANDVGVRAGDEVLVHTYDQRPDKTLVGEETAHGLFVRVDDILGVVEDDDVVSFWAQRKCDNPSCSMPSGHEEDCDDAAREVRVPLAIDSLGFFPRSVTK